MAALPEGRLCVFGKIPGRADFINRGLSPALRRVWDGWVEEGLAVVHRIYGPGWMNTLSVPIWRLCLPPELAPGAPGLIGVMLCGMDAVGRPYPLLLGVELAQPLDPLPLMAGSSRWFAAVEALGLDALDPAFDPQELDRRVLPRWHAADLPPVPGAPATAALSAALPMASAAAATAQRLCGDRADSVCLFWTAGTGRVPPRLAVMPALLPERLFPALIDGQWRSHGWPAEADPAPAGGWDREA
ncbi:type VI secretion system-associated protein TagF [Falsirhodobacter sp. 20TX0035]|uniref:type VI secretion system-associated protein TagF n=1 Tax=Falsirhodobacter sp. 20TX0035 TaxID=3022019 RepID=UPI00232AEF63|nr:type VI secretion system-associated protein TagF [Falsirhodobacter sp. 20TX0035]MDB6453073.1 type VI secretion system-associated protein TagF [Falsirhodobacter sp. 20TX0035]